jgi:hypothetical protein
MKTKAIKALAMVLLLVAVMGTLTACGGVPDGRYVPDADSGLQAISSTAQAIIIKGSNFTLDMGLLGATTVKYEYNKKTGAITLLDGGLSGLTVCEYKDGSIWFAGSEFKKQ